MHEFAYLFGTFVALPLLVLLAVKVFPDFFGKALYKLVEHTSEARLTVLRDELARDTAVHVETLKVDLSREASLRVETLKADLQGAYSTLKTSVDFLTAGQSGLRSEMVTAARNMWNAILRLREEFGAIVAFESTFLPEEIDLALRGDSDQRLLDWIAKFRDETKLWKAVEVVIPPSVEEGRLFVGDRLWLLFFVIRSVYFRLAHLAGRSLRERRHLDWRTDTGISSMLEAVLPKEFLDQVRRERINGLQSVLARLEADFLREASRVVSGSKAFAESVADLQATMLLHQQEAGQQAAIRHGQL